MVKYPKKRSSSSGVDRHFFKVYLPTDSSKRLNIPKQLVVDNNIQLSSEMILRDQTRRSWPVTTRFTSDGRYWITKGWHDFCVGNNIQENDYFTFEFHQGKGFSRTVIDVHITRPTCKGFNGA
ncbi:hypothetical protein IFM89_011900 [Coptis chinensis]|uniref:TF-B3 domain-containing protein n=1 Tax=Coptis chinensis TaxID=261450 RepID=A0A835I3A2_9MAGN|nr:hypothetical protein IFM89_011900 [Coptis chinensis]